MKVTLLLFLVVLTVSCYDAHAQNFFRRSWNGARNFGRRSWTYARGFGRGSSDMWRAYKDMRRANYIGADKYFHARGNYDASRHGTGGRHAATLLSNAREMIQSGSGRGHQDSAADQVANRWGRNGGDPNKYRPVGLPKKY